MSPRSPRSLRSPRPPGSSAPLPVGERLAVPLRWWTLATMFVVSMLLAFLVATPLWLAVAGTSVLVVLVVTVFVGYGSARIAVGDGVLRAGRARIPLTEVGAVQALDAAGTRLLAGREADARAYLLLRPYLKRSVRIEITDPADPTPYWLLGTRHPDRWVAALSAAAAQPAP